MTGSGAGFGHVAVGGAAGAPLRGLASLRTACRLSLALVPLGLAMWAGHSLFHVVTGWSTAWPTSAPPSTWGLTGSASHMDVAAGTPDAGLAPRPSVVPARRRVAADALRRLANHARRHGAVGAPRSDSSCHGRALPWRSTRAACGRFFSRCRCAGWCTDEAAGAPDTSRGAHDRP